MNEIKLIFEKFENEFYREESTGQLEWIEASYEQWSKLKSSIQKEFDEGFFRKKSSKTDSNKLPCGCDYEDCMCPVTEKEWTYLRKQVSRGRFDLIMNFLRDFNEETEKRIEELEDKLKEKDKENIELLAGLTERKTKVYCLEKKIKSLKEQLEWINELEKVR